MTASPTKYQFLLITVHVKSHPTVSNCSYLQQKFIIPYVSVLSINLTLFPTFPHRSYPFPALGRGKRVPLSLTLSKLTIHTYILPIQTITLIILHANLHIIDTLYFENKRYRLLKNIYTGNVRVIVFIIIL
jgi:hypothetical protein